MAACLETSGRVYRKLAAKLGLALLGELAGCSLRNKAEILDRTKFCDRETVVNFDKVDVLSFEFCLPERRVSCGNGCAHRGKVRTVV